MTAKAWLPGIVGLIAVAALRVGAPVAAQNATVTFSETIAPIV